MKYRDLSKSAAKSKEKKNTYMVWKHSHMVLQTMQVFIKKETLLSKKKRYMETLTLFIIFIAFSFGSYLLVSGTKGTSCEETFLYSLTLFNLLIA